MNRSSLAAVISLCMAIGIVSPALADDEALNKVVDGSLMVTRVGGVGTGVVVGTPVAVVRDSVKYYTHWTPAFAEHVGGKECGPCMGLVSLVTLPSALVWGGVTGVFHGTKNGVTKGFEEPFHPKSFSVVDYDAD